MKPYFDPRMREAATAIARDLIDRGLLIEAGWQSLRVMAVSPDAPQIQLVEMRMAFFAGAHHLFQSIMGTLDDGAEPTEPDLARMDAIDRELNEFIRMFAKEHLPTEGQG